MNTKEYETVSSIDLNFSVTVVQKKYLRNDRLRFFSTNHESRIYNAILLLITTDWGFKIGIQATPYNKNSDLKEHTLEIKRTGYGALSWGPEDFWHVFFDNEELGKFDNPNDAIELFLKKHQEYQIGHDLGL